MSKSDISKDINRFKEIAKHPVKMEAINNTLTKNDIISNTDKVLKANEDPAKEFLKQKAEKELKHKYKSYNSLSEAFQNMDYLQDVICSPELDYCDLCVIFSPEGRIENEKGLVFMSKTNKALYPYFMSISKKRGGISIFPVTDEDAKLLNSIKLTPRPLNSNIGNINDSDSERNDTLKFIENSYVKDKTLLDKRVKAWLNRRETQISEENAKYGVNKQVYTRTYYDMRAINAKNKFSKLYFTILAKFQNRLSKKRLDERYKMGLL